jgi:hypothetical protein
MPLARAALYARGVDIYLAPTWDNSEVWVPTLRHIAKEGRTYVIGVIACIRATGIPARLAGVTAMTVLGVSARHADLDRHPNSTNPPPAASTTPRPSGKAQSSRSESNSATVPGRL